MQSIPATLARSVLDAAPDAMIILDASGRILYSNRQTSTLFGYEDRELLGLAVEMLLPDRYRDRHVAHRRSYFAAGRPRPMGQGLELFGRRHDGSEFPVEISLSPIETEGEMLVAAAIRDVTERKRVERELIEARNAARELQHVAEEARNIADRANQGKSRFLATASHDLRQPLQTLSLLNRTLRGIISDARAREALDHEAQTLAAMARLLNALLDISKLESGAIRPEPTDFAVASLFESLRREFASLALNKGLDLRIEPSQDRAHSDPSLVEEILRNLVSNAIKYTRVGWVLLRALRDASAIRIEVLDSGIGIASDQIPLIFDEFYQIGVAVHTTRDGYGLGLSIVQRIAKLLEISIEVRSELGRGSAFSIMLPVGGELAEGQSKPEPADTRAAPGSAPRVLLVEDEPSVRNATKLLLSVEGYEVTAVSSLAEATEAARGATFDLLVTDYHLSGEQTGRDVIEAVRRAQGTTIPALLITGDTSSFIRTLTEDSRLRIVSKPVDADQMLRTLEQLLAACAPPEPRPEA